MSLFGVKKPIPENLHCSFCGKSYKEVKKLVAGPGIHICDACIGLCNDIIALEASPNGDKDPVGAARERLKNYLRVLLRPNASLLVIDIQERLSAAMDQPKLERLVRNTNTLIESAKTLGLPIFATEQYPKGLGPTVPAIKATLGDVPIPDKVAFSCVAVESVASKLKESGRTQVIVAGMETHVCVYQTVRDLIAAGYMPFVPRDAVLSRTSENHETGIELMRECGATITSTETIVFDLLGAAGTPEFKKLSALVK